MCLLTKIALLTDVKLLEYRTTVLQVVIKSDPIRGGMYCVGGGHVCQLCFYPLPVARVPVQVPIGNGSRHMCRLLVSFQFQIRRSCIPMENCECCGHFDCTRGYTALKRCWFIIHVLFYLSLTPLAQIYIILQDFCKQDNFKTHYCILFVQITETYSMIVGTFNFTRFTINSF